jgi:flavin reductase (DIM6/NTAB) family NADH-FMN oxidoreductase RutF
MEIEPSQVHRLLAPRLTVLVTTVDGEKRINAAPISFVSPISFSPPIVMISLAPTRHTYQNIIETREFVINILNKEWLDRLLRCAARFPRGVNELEQSGLRWHSSKLVAPPRVREASVWIECKYLAETKMGDHLAVFGQVLLAEVSDEITTNGEVDLEKLSPALHVAGNSFAVNFKIIERRRYD